MKKYILLLLLAPGIFISCNDNSTEQQASKQGIKERSFGNFEGKAVTEFTITNASGMKVSIIDYGATVTKLIVNDRDGKPGDVILGFDSLSGYLQKNNPYFGSTVGRYANRIANAKFVLNDTTYTLANNNDGQNLHGGLKGFDKVMWGAERLPGDSSIKFSYTSKDGEEGFPGNLKVEVIYSLSSDNGLKIEYAATTDKPTPVNLTNHCYFNLSAGKDSTMLFHLLSINADKYTPVNNKLIPLGEHATVTGTPFNFRQSKLIRQDIGAVNGGFDHNWVLNKKGNELEDVATLFDALSGRFMIVYTTEPGLQFYSGNFLDGTLKNTKAGRRYPKHGALCLEAQHFPDSPNEPGYPTTILKPGETYRQTTIYKFSVINH
jgi:aldose 1-epimerase